MGEADPDLPQLGHALDDLARDEMEAARARPQLDPALAPHRRRIQATPEGQSGSARRACRRARRGTGSPRPRAARAAARPWRATRRRARSGTTARRVLACGEHGAGEARRARATRRRRCARTRAACCGRAAAPAPRVEPSGSAMHAGSIARRAAPPRHLLDRRARPGDRRARRRRPVALVLRRLALHLGAARRRRGGDAVRRRARARPAALDRLAAGDDAATALAGVLAATGSRASARSARSTPAAASPPTPGRTASPRPATRSARTGRARRT